ncbi:MAG: archaellin/type IV pilin N-terminal domain-containing protein [Candidatus Bathyarchaeia archaeon]
MTAMNLRQIHRNKRGISEVVSAILLMGIVVSAMVLLLNATFTWVGLYQSYTGVAISNREDRLRERFVIEDVWYRTSDTRIYVSNVGEIDVTLVSVYIDHELRSTTNLPLKLVPGAGEWIIVSVGGLTGTHYIVVVSERGNKVEGYWRK